MKHLDLTEFEAYMPELGQCTGDARGHSWQLHRRGVWKVDDEKLPWRAERILWTIGGLLIPIFGWFFIAIYAIEDRYRSVGYVHEWYCTRCRQFEETREPWPT